VETNPPRNNRLRLIRTDEHGERALKPAPPANRHRVERSPCLKNSSTKAPAPQKIVDTNRQSLALGDQGWMHIARPTRPVFDLNARKQAPMSYVLALDHGATSSRANA